MMPSANDSSPIDGGIAKAPPLFEEPLNRQKALVALGRRALASPENSILIQDAASLLAGMLDADCGLAAVLDEDGRALDVSLVAPYCTDVDSHASAPHWQSSADGSDALPGYMLSIALPVKSADLNCERRFHDLALRKQGIRSLVGAPLMLAGRSFGAVAACVRQPREFGEEDALLVETVSHLISATIARGQSERWLADERRRSCDLLDTLDAIVLMLDRSGKVVRINGAGERLTGFTTMELRGRRIDSALAVPSEQSLFENAIGQLGVGRNPVQFESRMVTKHAQQRNIAWSLAASCDSQNEVASIIVTGIDITRERQLEARLLAEAERGANQSGSPPVEPTNPERRQRSRRSYPYRQLIAPIIQGKLPAFEQFFAVTCNDIGPGGFSFLVRRPLEAETLVVALGNAPRLTYLMARVAHVNPIEHDGRRLYLVGCAYTGRANYNVPETKDLP